MKRVDKFIRGICCYWVAMAFWLFLEFLQRGENINYKLYIIINIVCFVGGMVILLIVHIFKKKQYYFYGNPIKFFLFNHHCPICNTKLAKRMNHKLVNSYSEEADLYAHFFEDINGDRLSKKFDCDIKHKVFFCTHCNLEIEKKTLFSYNKVKKQLERLQKKAEHKKTKLDIVYLYDSDSKDQNFINIDTIIAKFSNQKGEFEKIVFLAKKRQKYEQAKYFEPTTDLKKCFRLV